jgi:predicted O-methyltransferase YrrM
MQHIYENIDGWFTFPNLYKMAVDESPDNAHFVEIGTWMGKSASYMAVEIINSKKNIKFDCIDTWQGSIEHTDREEIKENTLYDKFISNIEPIKNNINTIRMPSLEAVNLYQDNSLDFVFIDAAHDYENVIKDIRAWYPKVKKNGLFAGHDYDPSWHGVIKAVDEFANEKGYILSIKSELCWGFRKK